MKHSESSNAVFAQALSGIKFPATHAQLVEQAEKNGAAPNVLEVIRAMPNEKGETYNNMPDVYMNTREGKDAVAKAHATEATSPAKAKGATEAKAK